MLVIYVALPNDDHFLTLFFIVGAPGADTTKHDLSPKVISGMLTVDSIVFNQNRDLTCQI
jgi:hypothetical protein